MSADRAYRPWRTAGLQVPRRRPRKRAATGRARLCPATDANQVWAYDFVFDGCANGHQLKCLTVIDEFTRECLAIDVAGSLRSGRVVEVGVESVSKTSELIVLDASQPEKDAIAGVEIPLRVPFGFHGSWIADSVQTVNGWPRRATADLRLPRQ